MLMFKEIEANRISLGITPGMNHNTTRKMSEGEVEMDEVVDSKEKDDALPLMVNNGQASRIKIV